MGCCGGNNIDFSKVIETCKVCELLDKDKTKKRVAYCDICHAYICEKCTFDLKRRAEAMAMNWGIIAEEFGDKLIDKVKQILNGDKTD